MDKLVKVTVTGRPIPLSNSVKAFGCHGPIKMSINDIFTCLAAGATVVEVNGKEEVLLNFANYKTDNFKKVTVPKAPEIKQETEIKPIPNANPDMVEDVLIPNATPMMHGGIAELNYRPELISDESLEEVIQTAPHRIDTNNENLQEIIDAVDASADTLPIETPYSVDEVPVAEVPAILNAEDPTAPAINAVEETIASEFIPKTDKNNHQQNNKYHGKNKNRR